MSTAISILMTRVQEKSAKCGVIGLGYVGLPFAVAAARRGFRTVGFDIDPAKPKLLKTGQSYIESVRSDELRRLVQSDSLGATDEFAGLKECDVIVICVPTPLTRQREPDMSFIVATAETIAKHLRRGQLISLESTTYPGTTREVLKPILETSGLLSGVDFLLGFSPEREDPGNADYSTVTMPKVVAGEDRDATIAMEAFYGAVVDKVVPVSTSDTAEAVKITENVFRAVNIALVNELKVVFDRMGIDIWEVIDAAKTKPFGFMPFYPGPGLGGHCIPIDPFYLTWKSREFEVPTRFIELAGEINHAMPRYVIGKLEEALDRRRQMALGQARVLVVGLAYKKNVADIRESPSFKLMELLKARGVEVGYHDPHVAVVPPTREYKQFEGQHSISLDEATLHAQDAVLISTDHDDIDYELIVRAAPLIVDTRNACARRGYVSSHIVKA
ncbi:MAG: nucleotide sugar dehydrogenase [Alphaproteobacteria bacterium]|nr:nucleotide sugar dehydrogenase [Alphaproteobacteria bacterium]MDE2493938.1 nucleotide sugar dehydrogenase [Alphaproteobacteria bacterium]